jgi:hypothetical protein
MEQERLACRRQDRLSLFNFDFDPTRQLHTTPDLCGRTTTTDIQARSKTLLLDNSP